MAVAYSPLVIIGAGRSGSSLLVDLLDTHPAIALFGEMNFAVGRLWDCFWNTPAAEGVRARLQEAALRAAKAEGAAGPEIEERIRCAERQERARVHALVAETVERLLRRTECAKPYWGFKEIWLNRETPYGWELYDAVFPRAFYVHLVRDPFSYARSTADWNYRPFTAEELRRQLAAWVDYLEYNRAAARTGRYVLLTYESLVADPRRALAPLLKRLGLAWDDACLASLSRGHVPSGRRSPYPPDAAALAAQVAGLGRLMKELGYRAPDPRGRGEPAPPPQAAAPLGPKSWRLNPPFQRDGACGWVATPANAPVLAEWDAVTDNVEHPMRSPLRLYEDGRPLGPAHCLHVRIREEGGGGFSHWAGPLLLFSTRDNSDPNRNGRVYTVDFGGGAT